LYENMKPLRFTRHARDRMKENQLDERRVINLFNDAFEEKLPYDLRRRKHTKYRGQSHARYFRNGPYVMTITEKKDTFTGEDINLLITIIDQRVTLHEYYGG